MDGRRPAVTPGTEPGLQVDSSAAHMPTAARAAVAQYSGVDFASLALIALIGMLGPLLALPRHWPVPVVIGELAGGILLGRTGFGVLHPDDKTFSFLADVGFALVMFVAGSHVPVRDPTLRASVRVGVARAAGVGVLAVPLAWSIAHALGTGHTALYAVLIASSSAALVLPVLDELGVREPQALALLPQVAIADVACIVALPLAIDPSRAGRSALGTLVVVAAASIFYVLLGKAERSGRRKQLHRLSERRGFALELRISLFVLFGLAALATRSHTSVLLAGFALGVAVGSVGEPRRLARQLFAIADGFLAPLFFVWLGATLDIRALGTHPSFIVLGLLLGAAAVVAHLSMALTKQSPPFATLACAQLGVPVAASTLGTQLGVLMSGESSALILGAIVTLVAATIAAAVAR
jgi:Kef-type K+ transport system membrane component KefB